IGTDFQRNRAGSRAQWLHQMRSDLGRLDAIAEILQVGPFVEQQSVCLASWSARWYVARKMQGSIPCRFSARQRYSACWQGRPTHSTRLQTCIGAQRCKATYVTW